jgi:AraC family transcriptional regulator
MTNANEKRLLRVLDHIHDNPAGDLSLDALSDVAAMSRFHWHRVFRAMTGETLAQAVRRIRMQRASYLLVMTAEPLTAISAKVGMENLASFNRCFAEQFLMSPTAFRNRGELRPFARNPLPRRSQMYPVAIRTEAPIRLAAVPHKGAYFEISRAFQKLSAVMASRDLFRNAGRMIAVFYDDPQSVAEPDLRSHAGFEITGRSDLSAPLEEVALAGGRQAVLTYNGPYAGLPAAYSASGCLSPARNPPIPHPSRSISTPRWTPPRRS